LRLYHRAPLPNAWAAFPHLNSGSAMKKLALVAALASLLSMGNASAAQTAEAAAPFKFLLGVGLTFGGDTLINVPFTDGSSDDIKAGGLVHFYGGGEYRFTDTFAVQGTIGYHVNQSSAASNGSVRFTRIPVDVLGLYSITEKIRLGGGAQFVNGAQLKGSGVASMVNEDFKSSTGLIVEGEYLFSPHLGAKLRYVSEKYKSKLSGADVDGSHVGMMFSYYF
jgi:hypothetical protein